MFGITSKPFTRRISTSTSTRTQRSRDIVATPRVAIASEYGGQVNLHPALRPLERRVVQLVDDGIATTEIAQRFRRSPEMITRIIGMAALPDRATAGLTRREGLRPLERRVLAGGKGGRLRRDRRTIRKECRTRRAG